MSDLKINPKSPGSFVRCVSGLFINKNQPHGLSPKELTVVACILSLTTGGVVITKELKEQVSNQLNQKYQVTVNYVNKFKKKGIITKEDKLHPIFFKKKITIEYGA